MTAPTIGGVQIRRHVLDLEAPSLAWLARRVGRRLQRWLKQTPDDIQGHQIEWVQGTPVSKPMLHADGSPVMVPCLPDADFRENWRWYQATILGLLKEQRERAKLTPKNGAPALSDEEYEAALREMIAETIRTMPAAELETLLEARKKPAIVDVSAPAPDKVPSE